MKLARRSGGTDTDIASSALDGHPGRLVEYAGEAQISF